MLLCWLTRTGVCSAPQVLCVLPRAGQASVLGYRGITLPVPVPHPSTARGGTGGVHAPVTPPPVYGAAVCGTSLDLIPRPRARQSTAVRPHTHPLPWLAASTTRDAARDPGLPRGPHAIYRAGVFVTLGHFRVLTRTRVCDVTLAQAHHEPPATVCSTVTPF